MTDKTPPKEDSSSQQAKSTTDTTATTLPTTAPGTALPPTAAPPTAATTPAAPAAPAAATTPTAPAPPTTSPPTTTPPRPTYVHYTQPPPNDIFLILPTTVLLSGVSRSLGTTISVNGELTICPPGVLTFRNLPLPGGPVFVHVTTNWEPAGLDRSKCYVMGSESHDPRVGGEGWRETEAE